MIPTNVHWDVKFHHLASSFHTERKKVVDEVLIDIRRKLSKKDLQIKITEDGITTAAKLLDRFLGSINIYGALLDEDGYREKENELLKSDIDCEICSYLYKGQTWWHILNIDSSFSSNGFTKTPISGREYSLEYMDK